MNIQLQRIYHQIEEELDSFENQLKKLEVPNYPTQTCRDLILKLEKQIGEYRNIVKNIMKEIDEENPEETQKRLIASVHIPLIKRDFLFLNWIFNAQTANVPWSFIPCIEKLSEAISPGSKLLVYCSEIYNYGICWSKSRQVAPYPYYLLSLPSLHRVNVLWHTLIGHELFHPCCTQFIDKHNQEVLTNITKKITEEYEKSVKTEEDDKGLFSEEEKKDRIDEISKTTHFAWRRAMEELLSDMGCVELFGPAAILAMKAFFACSPINVMPDPDNNFYPSNLYRFEVTWKYFIDLNKLSLIYSGFNKFDIFEYFKEEMDEFEKLVRQSKGNDLVQKHSQAKIAYEEVERLIEQSIEFVKKAIPKNICRWHSDKVIAQIPKLVERLSKGIPPNEIITEINEVSGEKYETEPAELSAILIAGWIYETYWQKKYMPESNLMAYKTMLKLLLKSCENVQLLNNLSE